ncbi:MAG: ABC transporter ATP-binding protein [Candidatus Dadabacteria bacterium]
MELQKEYKDQKNPVIVIEGLQKSFGDNHVLKGINLTVNKGENLVVMGRSGMGKSVLIKIIVGLMFPDAGTVKVFGKEVDKLTAKQLHDLRLKIGFSFQGSALYDSMTVRENLEYALTRNKRHLTRQQRLNSVYYVLDEVGLLNTINQYPSELSGGQKKRIGIARTLIMEPEIMLYDEPTSGLDPLTSVDINNLIKMVQKNHNTTSMIITHDLACAKQTGDRIVVLVNGKFVAEGNFDEVFSSENAEIKGFYDYNFTTT